jgi:alcohol dehydrogenase (cytochrome c)
VLSTAGGLVFGGDMEGHVFALRARDGKRLWSFPTGSMPIQSMTYAVKGRQYVAFTVGWGTLLAAYSPAFAPELADVPRGSMMIVFGLPED